MVVEKTVEQQVVVVTNTVVQIQPSNPQVVYVPTYNPYTVYYPPPAYVYNPLAPLVTFGAGMAVGAIIANNCDWYHGGCYHRNVNVDVDRNVQPEQQLNRNDNINRGANAGAPAVNRAHREMAARPEPPEQERCTQRRKLGPQHGGAGLGIRRASSLRPAASERVLPPELPAHAPPPEPPARDPPPATPQHGLPPARPRPAGPRRLPARAGQVRHPALRNAKAQSFCQPSRPPSGSAFSGGAAVASARSSSSRGASSRGGGGFSGGGGGGGGRVAVVADELPLQNYQRFAHLI